MLRLKCSDGQKCSDLDAQMTKTCTDLNAQIAYNGNAQLENNAQL